MTTTIPPEPRQLDRQPPCDLDAERFTLAALMVDPSTIDRLTLQAGDFHDEAHRLIYGAMHRLHNEGIPFEPTFLADELRHIELSGDENGFDRVGGWATLTKVAAVSADSRSAVVHNADHYARLLRDKSLRRRVADLGHELLSRSHNGTTPAELIEFLRDQSSNIEQGADGKDVFEVMDCKALGEFESDIEYLVDWTLAAGQPAIIAGPKKALKTSVGLDLGLSLATGTPFLGRMDARQSVKVLFCSGESGLPTIRETTHRISDAKGLVLPDVQGFWVTTELPKFGDAASLLKLRRTLKRTEAEVLFVDPLYLCLDAADVNNLFAVGERLRPISELCQDSGITLILLHHTKKNTGRDRYSVPELEDIAWSGFSEWCRQWLLIDRRERYEPGTGEHRLWLSVGGSAGHSRLWAVDVNEGSSEASEGRQWDVTVHSPEHAIDEAEREKQRERARRQEEKDDDDRRRMLDALQKYPKGETKTALRELASLSGERASKALTVLIGEGRAEACPLTKNRRSENGFKPTGK